MTGQGGWSVISIPYSSVFFVFSFERSFRIEVTVPQHILPQSLRFKRPSLVRPILVFRSIYENHSIVRYISMPNHIKQIQFQLNSV